MGRMVNGVEVWAGARAWESKSTLRLGVGEILEGVCVE